jgi:hypothetical protein
MVPWCFAFMPKVELKAPDRRWACDAHDSRIVPLLADFVAEVVEERSEIRGGGI